MGFYFLLKMGHFTTKIYKISQKWWDFTVFRFFACPNLCTGLQNSIKMMNFYCLIERLTMEDFERNIILIEQSKMMGFFFRSWYLHEILSIFAKIYFGFASIGAKSYIFSSVKDLKCSKKWWVFTKCLSGSLPFTSNFDL